MAETNSDQSQKTEKATPHKLREARKQGNVAKSTEVNTALAVIAGIVLLLAVGDTFIHNVLDLCRDMLLKAGELSLSQASTVASLSYWMVTALGVLSPIIVVLALVGVLASFIQTGAIFSFHPLKPNLSRLNPVTGFKNRFSQRFLWDTVKTLLKFSVLSAIAGITIVSLIPVMMKFSALQPSAIVSGFNEASAGLLARLACALIVIAILDLLYTRWEYLRKQRMTKQELKDEVKRREGDPGIRSRRKELETELRKRSASLNNVPGADVIITNPTRFAVALRFNRETMIAPHIVGLGSGPMARLMREKAGASAVPVVCMPRLARQLFKVGRIDQAIPQECYVPVAKALRQAYAMRGNIPAGVLS